MVDLAYWMLGFRNITNSVRPIMIQDVHNLRMPCGGIVALQAFSSNAKCGFAMDDTVVIKLHIIDAAFEAAQTGKAVHSTSPRSSTRFHNRRNKS